MLSGEADALSHAPTSESRLCRDVLQRVRLESIPRFICDPYRYVRRRAREWYALGAHRTRRILRSEERRVGKECRSLCDWSSDVCSSDLDLWIRNLCCLGKRTRCRTPLHQNRVCVGTCYSASVLNLFHVSFAIPIDTSVVERGNGMH